MLLVITRRQLEEGVHSELLTSVLGATESLLKAGGHVLISVRRSIQERCGTFRPGGMRARLAADIRPTAADEEQ